MRIGNAAHDQLQLDVFGEVMDALHQGRRGGLPASEAGWDVQIALLEHLAEIWRKPDHGIWEVRTEPMHFTYSKAMAWVAFDRALKSAEMFGLPGPVEHWRELCARRSTTMSARKGWNAKRNTFTRSYGSRRSRREPAAARADRLPQAGRSALSRHRRGDRARPARRRLRAALRLAQVEGRPAGRRRRVPRLQLLARRRLSAARPPRRRRDGCSSGWSALCNDVGLLSEEYDPRAKRQLGNFPQAFSHVALINTAFNLTRAEKPAEQRSDLPKGTAKSAEATSI